MVLEASRWVPGVGAALAGPQGHSQSLALCCPQGHEVRLQVSATPG